MLHGIRVPRQHSFSMESSRKGSTEIFAHIYSVGRLPNLQASDAQPKEHLHGRFVWQEDSEDIIGYLRATDEYFRVTSSDNGIIVLAGLEHAPRSTRLACSQHVLHLQTESYHELAEGQAPPHGYFERSGKGFVVPIQKSLVLKPLD